MESQIEKIINQRRIDRELMKILIVDDNATRYEQLIAQLSSLQISRNGIDFVSSKDCAIEKLAQNKYDLMILDFLIPLWPDEKKVSVQNSIDLINEMDVTGELKLPNHIIGITADKSLAQEGVKLLESKTWLVIEYSPFSNDWINQISNCIRYMTAEKPIQTESKIDVVVVCALKDPELEAVLDLDWNWSSRRPLNDSIFITEGKFKSGGKEFSVCACHMDRMGMVPTAATSRTLIHELKPKLIVMTGICAGLRDKTGYGDAIFAETVWDYQTGKYIRDDANPKFQIDPHQLQATHEIKVHALELASDKTLFANMAANYRGNVGVIPKFHLAPMATGSAVIADSQYLNQIVSQQRKVKAIEMEAYGMYYAAETSPRPKPKYFAIKSVCDHGDEQKGDDFQNFAAYTSARTMQALLEIYGFRFL